MMIIRKDNDKWISTDKKEMEIDLHKLIINIKKYKIATAEYIGDDLKIVVQKIIYKNGKKNIKSKIILFKDYVNNEKYFTYMNFNDEIRSLIENNYFVFNKDTIKKIVLIPTASILIIGGITVVYDNPYQNSNIKDLEVKENYVNYVDKMDVISKIETTDIDKGYTENSIDSDISTQEEYIEEESKEDIVYNKLKEYCDYFNFNEELISKIFSENYTMLLNNDNIEETIMRLVYDYYTENLYLELYIEPNTLSEDEIETYIVKFANVLGINNEEILYTMLSVHELETGHGTSNLCLEKNNMGGITFVNPETGELEFQHYPNAIVGALGFVINFDRIYKSTIPDEYSDYNFDWNTIDSSIEDYMKPMYCDEPMNDGDPEWDELVCDVKYTLKKNDRLKEINQMLKDLDNRYISK